MDSDPYRTSRPSCRDPLEDEPGVSRRLLVRPQNWSRKKITEQLVAQQSSNASPPQNTRELNDALAFLYQVQFIFVDEANKKISWSPEDVRTWSTERPVWAFSLGSRAIFHGPGEESVAKQLGHWVSERELAKWKIHWPTAEGTLETLKLRYSETNVGTTFRTDKPKKADYATVLGRQEAIKSLAKFGAHNISEDVIV
jgi:hypothetical protein